MPQANTSVYGGNKFFLRLIFPYDYFSLIGEQRIKGIDHWLIRLPNLYAEMFGYEEDETSASFVDEQAFSIMDVLHQPYSEILQMDTAERNFFYNSIRMSKERINGNSEIS